MLPFSTWLGPFAAAAGCTIKLRREEDPSLGPSPFGRGRAPVLVHLNHSPRPNDRVRTRKWDAGRSRIERPPSPEGGGTEGGVPQIGRAPACAWAADFEEM